MLFPDTTISMLIKVQYDTIRHSTLLQAHMYSTVHTNKSSKYHPKWMAEAGKEIEGGKRK